MKGKTREQSDPVRQALDVPCVVEKVAVSVRDLLIRLLWATEMFVIERLAQFTLQKIMNPVSQADMDTKFRVEGRRRARYPMHDGRHLKSYP